MYIYTFSYQKKNRSYYKNAICVSGLPGEEQGDWSAGTVLPNMEAEHDPLPREPAHHLRVPQRRLRHHALHLLCAGLDQCADQTGRDALLLQVPAQDHVSSEYRDLG